MKLYLNIAEIVISVVVIMVILLQVRGGGLGGIFGTQEGVYRARRGLEKSLFRLTIGLVTLFIILSVISVKLG
ncbi:MAG: preprotein translocase subunit SecG [Chloroflexota bacterium]|nr:preprotein translocase subunit SecG [Chloroflexota bacterium]